MGVDKGRGRGLDRGGGAGLRGQWAQRGGRGHCQGCGVWRHGEATWGGSENPFRPHKRKKRLKENILCVILPRKIHSGCLLVQRHIAAKINQDERNSTARDGEPLGLCLGIKAACVAPEPLGMIL